MRLWLSIVIDDEIAESAGNGEFNEHTKPRQLPNLDCNIICGNSLIDEFEGFPLITESVLLHNESENRQQNIFQSSVDGLISKLIELQDKLLSNAGEYCANSVNYLMCGQDNFYFLGLLNSHLLNWYFAKLSTNSNVNGYEVDNIPIKIDETKKKYISELVERLLENPTDYESEDELNTLIYDMCGLSKDERKIVERRYL